MLVYFAGHGRTEPGWLRYGLETDQNRGRSTCYRCSPQS
jgi:hypothetical protein